MKLKLRRSQKQGMTGIKFVLFAIVDLDEHERTSLNKYQLGKTVLYSSEEGDYALALLGSKAGLLNNLKGLGLSWMAKASNQLIMLGALISGKEITCKDINELIGVEEQMRAACENLARILYVCENFDGEEIIDITPFESTSI